MSLFEQTGSGLPNSTADASQDPLPPRSLSAALMSATETSPTALSLPPVLDPHNDARAIVRLVQCQQCSLPLRQPLTLPCGNSICRPCMPQSYRRENISYPSLPNRLEGFACPFEDCGLEHSLGDCSQDVTLAKVLDRVSIEMARYRPITSDTPMLLDERLHWQNIIDSRRLKDATHSRVLNGGRLVATYTMAELGELRYTSEVSYQSMSTTGDSYQHLDLAMLEHLREVTRNEMDCQVCYALMLDPLTTACGHTFCRKCVSRVFDHSPLCPICRRTLQFPQGLNEQQSNKRLSKLLLTFCPEYVAARVEAVEAEEASATATERIPLFVCTLAYPEMPTFLHIFEPRYRLMIRRAIESGDRKFGMLRYNQRGDPQGELGNTQFMQCGTLLHIVNMQLFPDGRSLIETRGVSRFKVSDHSMLDGYVVGRVERVDDIPMAEEEALEASEVDGRTANLPFPSRPPSNAPLHTLSTMQLLRIGTDFINRMHAVSAPWLSASVIAAYGHMPEDPALFPYWVASVLPIDEAEKYRLLPTTSVRERLKITAEWVRRVETVRW